MEEQITVEYSSSVDHRELKRRSRGQPRLKTSREGMWS